MDIVNRTNKVFPPYRGKVPINIPVVRITENSSIPSTNDSTRLRTPVPLSKPNQVKYNTVIPPNPQPINESNKSSIKNNNQSETFSNPPPLLENNKYKPISNRINTTNFWLEDPSSLMQTFDIIPNPDMTDAERLNAMTRVIIAISAIMYLIKYPAWWIFLSFGIILVVILWFIMKGQEYTYNTREYLRKPRNPIIETMNTQPMIINQPITVHTQPINLMPLH